jgi:hypothetical protein
LTTFPLRSSVDFDNQMKAGLDGRRDWIERKMCNLLTDMDEGCGKVLDNQCYKEKEISMWKDLSMEVFTENLEQYVDNWDSEKCPAAK